MASLSILNMMDLRATSHYSASKFILESNNFLRFPGAPGGENEGENKGEIECTQTTSDFCTT